MKRNSAVSDYLFPALKRNLVSHKFKNDLELEKVVIMWLTVLDMRFY